MQGDNFMKFNGLAVYKLSLEKCQSDVKMKRMIEKRGAKFGLNPIFHREYYDY